MRENTPSPFAKLQPLMSDDGQDVAESFARAARSLASYESAARIHVRLLDVGSAERIDHWDVEAGSPTATARNSAPESADVILVLRRDTWLQIAQGRLSPFDALFAGRLRVGGDTELAKGITRHLSDPAVPFVAPC